MFKSVLFGILLLLSFGLSVSCSNDDPMRPDPPASGGEEPDVVLTDEELLDLVQRETFKYFWDYAEQNSGAARERFHPNDPGLSAPVVAVGGTGFGLMSMLVATERNFITRTQLNQRLDKILAFLESADRFHGAWPHWLNGNTGKVIPFSALDDGGDLVETAFLCQGLLSVYAYLADGNTEEQALAEKAYSLWTGVEWDWYTQGEKALYWHWSPNHGFDINFKLEGYNEVLITYVLAAASPTHPIEAEAYHQGWAANGNIQSSGMAYGYPLLVEHKGDAERGGPLFWAHYSYLGLNPFGLSDAYADYEKVNTNHVLINYAYCLENPKGFDGYGADFWGLTASYSRNADGSLGYSAHSPANDLGIISPTAAVASLPFAPEQSLKAIRAFYLEREKLMGPAGFYDAFSSDLSWVAEAYLAIDQGPQIVMIENHRSGLLWNLFMANEDVQQGLDRLGFSY